MRYRHIFANRRDFENTMFLLKGFGLAIVIAGFVYLLAA